jgi:hypothetical protein
MSHTDYPVDVRADYPERSSRGWAALTIFWIKFFALIPHGIILIFLGIAQWVVAFIAQFVVAFKGEYPAGMHTFVTGVLRWQTRVGMFLFSLNDRYPPFTLQPLDDYPADVVADRPAEPSRMYAAFTIVVQVLGFVALVWLVVWFIDQADTIASWSTDGSGFSYQFNLPSWGGSGLLLRQLAAIPHYIVLAFIGIAAFVLWFVVQWVILFVARFPQGMWEVVAGYVRWYTRVNAYALGLVDRYPPFTFDPSLTAEAPPAAPQPSWPAAPPAAGPQAPSAPGPQAPSATWPAAPPPPAAPAQAPPPPPQPVEPSQDPSTETPERPQDD